MISLTTIPKVKLIAVANLVLATGCVVVAIATFVDYYKVVNSGKSYDPEILIGPYLAVIVLLPLGGLLCTAAAAHWLRWSGRWIVQGLAIALPVAILLVLFSL
jgi:hypothetical protein